MQASGTPARHKPSGPRAPHVRTRGILGASVVVFVFWLVISTSLAPVDLVIGAVLSVLLGWWSVHFLWAGQAPQIPLRRLPGMLLYLLAFSGQVFLSALHVARVVMDPDLPIRPRMIVCRTGLRRQISRIAFAHSVTLTPGTLTVDSDGGTFLVHCLDDESAERILCGEVERRIARVFEPEVGP